MKKIVFIGGKGGVGKTTCSSAFAVYCAKAGKKTLLVSTDPAHSTSDIFERTIGLEIVNIRENLDAIEIDAEFESTKYINKIKGNLKNIVSPVIVEEITRQLDAAIVSPGSHESAMFDKMTEIINEKVDEYDQIIFDTAPTGHTIRLLSLPEMLGTWIDSLMAKRRKAVKLFKMANSQDPNKLDDDPILKILMRRKNNMEKARNIMIDDQKLQFIFVLNAEKLPIEETKKAVNILKKYNIPVNELIVNRILPEDMKDDFWKNKKGLERKYLNEISEAFSNQKIIRLPLLQNDMRAQYIDEVAEYFKDIY
ncbi:ArsA family ATPase [Marinisporobacter balticus]|uniref:Arsenite efflux ATP-binding protein ArsA n=1 Tax=Marinisporobacter balticus TaxID=2018667 RepID=A0A4R2KFY0_9FIRM|nr:TRC40/GET3/ArsA family transport-energizing ATPase [Marinisporobacter balticus]TCO68868.1 arsenite efflux ATP-binding protein ArsA [Marinisporobacter balticus]